MAVNEQAISDTLVPPREPFVKLFLRFLRFGFLAWGGPVAQIAMIRQELVEEEKWISKERFNRTLAIYQVLPGPEAHELCVYFGMVSRGRPGAVLAGLGFMLPGFVLMFALSWFYVTFGINSPLFQSIFLGFQAAVVALIIRAVHRIGGHVLHDRWTWGIALGALVAQLLKIHFAITLVVAGAVYSLIYRRWSLLAGLLGVGFLAGVAIYGVAMSGVETIRYVEPGRTIEPGSASTGDLLISGFRGGLLTFGGAYTAIPFLQYDAVVRGGWMTNGQFLDGIALSGILPAPLIIFSTFVGYFGGGPLGALAMTFGIFLPAFSFTLIGHDLMERVIENKAIHSFLDGITAGVVGIIAATTIQLFITGVTSIPALIICVLALIAVYRWKAKIATAGIVLGAGLLGLAFF